MTTVTIIPSWTIADRLTKARRVVELTQEQLASRMGVNQKTIARYETGGPVKRTTVMAWALACGVDYRWLLDGDDADIDATTLNVVHGQLPLPLPGIAA